MQGVSGRVMKTLVAMVASALSWASVIDALFATQEQVGRYSQVDLEVGFNLYNANCITCHGQNGDSVPGVDLRSGQFRHASSDNDLRDLIQTGIPGTAMPAGRFNTGELAALVGYLRAMHDFGTQ